MANRYLVVSDLHLCDVEDNPDGWMAYKSARYLFDGVVRTLEATTGQTMRMDDVVLYLDVSEAK